MRISEFFNQLKLRGKLLYYTGWVLIAISILMIIPLMIDSRLVMGINPWIKPMKFSISTAIYIWTYSWLLHDIQKPWYKLKSSLKWVLFISMVIEMAIVIVQGARGVRSHFNFETNIDSLLFGVMGLFIMINTVIIFILAIMYFFKQDNLKPNYLLAVRLALIIFIVGNMIGGMMISNGQHAVGVSDGGEGLPFLNWSKLGGDLRIAHFMGLHSLQIIPFLSYIIIQKVESLMNQRILIIALTIIYSVILYALTNQALAGQPLIG